VLAKQKWDFLLYISKGSIFFIILFKQIALVPREHASQRTDVFKAFDTLAPIKETLTFDSVTVDDLSHLSLEVSMFAALELLKAFLC